MVGKQIGALKLLLRTDLRVQQCPVLRAPRGRLGPCKPGGLQFRLWISDAKVPTHTLWGLGHAGVYVKSEEAGLLN